MCIRDRINDGLGLFLNELTRPSNSPTTMPIQNSCGATYQVTAATAIRRASRPPVFTMTSSYVIRPVSRVVAAEAEYICSSAPASAATVPAVPYPTAAVGTPRVRRSPKTGLLLKIGLLTVPPGRGRHSMAAVLAGRHPTQRTRVGWRSPRGPGRPVPGRRNHPGTGQSRGRLSASGGPVRRGTRTAVHLPSTRPRRQRGCRAEVRPPGHEHLDGRRTLVVHRHRGQLHRQLVSPLEEGQLLELELDDRPRQVSGQLHRDGVAGPHDVRAELHLRVGHEGRGQQLGDAPPRGGLV